MTHYELLEISETASIDVINAAWKALLKIHHTDVGGDAEIAKQLNQAHDVLADPKLRRAYDQELAAQRQFQAATQSADRQRYRPPFQSGNWNEAHWDGYDGNAAYPDPMYGHAAQPQTLEDFFNMGLRNAYGQHSPGFHDIASQLSGVMTEQLIGLVFHRLPVMLRQPFMDAIGRARTEQQKRKAG